LRQGQAAISREPTLALIERLREAPSGSPGMRPVKSPLSPETIRSHVKNILRELKVRSRREAVAMADEMRKATPPFEAPERGCPQTSSARPCWLKRPARHPA
jgi:Bacterial regulatory proteins, luxR family